MEKSDRISLNQIENISVVPQSKFNPIFIGNEQTEINTLHKFKIVLSVCLFVMNTLTDVSHILIKKLDGKV